MKKETRQKTVDYDVYIAEDGKEFINENDCVLYDRMLKGEVITCPECKGVGRVDKWEEWENYHTGAPERTLCHPYCDKCHGKGYLEKKVVWQ